ncbi:MAG: gamma-glutamylcyclotransferase family protein [Bacteroidota bacterium]|nr:gamma-glutamylcyclotransferase [Candidatus Kapabacteria bacterium]MDW8220969.1 gamma-glutamylcyclotransferase family protein [Bacteroidota bacterium]
MSIIPQEYLFVYGTLGRATHPYSTPHYMHTVLTAFATYVGRASIQGRMYFVAQYPGVVASDNPSDIVLGEVYAITTNPHHNALLWKLLDEYEGNDGSDDALYVRTRYTAVLDHQHTLEVWVYFYNRSVDTLERIVTGDFSQPFAEIL